MTKIALIIGSLSQRSINRNVAHTICQNVPAEVHIEEVQISDLPLYTQDLDQHTVESYERVRRQIRGVDAVLIVSPEHNRGIPAAMKNVLDVVSRPFGQNLWAGKKVAVVTASPGSYGGINSGLHLRQSLQAVGANVLNAPEVYLSRASLEIDERTQGFLAKFAAAFWAWAK